MNWAELIRDAGLEGRTKMIRRDEVRAGDELLSSHYGRRIVKSATQHGTEGQTTEIIFESPASCRILNERYGSSREVPKIMPDTLIVTTLHSRCEQCNAETDAAIKLARVVEEGTLTYNNGGHGATVERETYAQRRAALGADS